MAMPKRTQKIAELSKTDQLLILACKEVLSPGEQQNLQHLVSHITNWEDVITGASRNRVLVQLSHHLSAYKIPKQVMVHLRELVLQTCQRVHMVKRAFEKILPIILKHHPKLILLRGISYQYTNDATRLERTIGDIDLLVKTRPAFSVAGFFRDHYPVSKDVIQALPQGMEIEYHYDLGIYTAWGMRTAQMPMHELWYRANALQIGSNQVAVLSPEDNFLYLCHHNLTKGFVELYRFVDLYHILKTSPIHWETLRQRAQKYGVARAVWLNGYVLEQIYGNAIPQKIMAQCQPAFPLKHLILWLLDFKSILHDPNPILRDPHSSLLKNAKRVLIIMLTLARLDNLHKILWAPFNKLLHGIHYKIMTQTKLHTLWQTGKQQWEQLFKANPPTQTTSVSQD